MTERNRAPFFVIAAAGSAAGFWLLARAVARRKTAPADHDLHERIAVDEEHPARDVAERVSPLGKWWTYVPLATIAAAYVAVKAERHAGGAAILTAAVAAALINKRFDDLLDQPPAPPGRDTPDHPVFPSGHTFGTSAVALTAAYVLSREELAAAYVVFPAALTLPLISATARLMEEKHWVSDIAGGVLAAMTLSSVALAAYEAGRERRT
ncbi:MAG TPA: phosphatase PAP2 family protein [Thermoanaerobaculia bacterium]|nr:phosphatase PAP2 family protein [Thermoanaerobaculia bacterium]